jgi:hypothetical protein
MKKLHLVGALVVGTLLLGSAGSSGSRKSSSSNSPQVNSVNSESISEPKITAKPVCDGSSVTSNCVLDSINYKTYIYHPSVPEKSHTEQITTYNKQVSGYCTLCRDGSYSPSCATGSGACSHHGGVAEWNAPRYSNVPIYTNKTVIDLPAQAAFFEKVAE